MYTIYHHHLASIQKWRSQCKLFKYSIFIIVWNDEFRTPYSLPTNDTHIKDVYTNLHRIPNSKLVIKNQLSSEFQQITTSVLKGLKTKYIELNKQFTFQKQIIKKIDFRLIAYLSRQVCCAFLCWTVVLYYVNCTWICTTNSFVCPMMLFMIHCKLFQTLLFTGRWLILFLIPYMSQLEKF